MTTPTPTPARRTRHDGWTEDRKAALVAALERGGTIAAIAASVGMSRRSVYRLRLRADGAAVAAAWPKAELIPHDFFFDIIDRGLDREQAAFEGYTNVKLLRELRAELRRERRRAWAAVRRAKAGEKAGRRAQVGDLHPVAPVTKAGRRAQVGDFHPAAADAHRGEKPGRRAQVGDLHPVTHVKNPVVA